MLQCMVAGEPFPTVYWLDKDNNRSNSTILTIQSVTDQKGGRYTCVADNGMGGDGITSKSIYLKVQCK